MLAVGHLGVSVSEPNICVKLFSLYLMSGTTKTLLSCSVKERRKTIWGMVREFIVEYKVRVC